MTTSSSLPPIKVGTRLTDFAALDLIVEGSAEGGFGLVVWGPNQANGGQMAALKLLRPDLLAAAEAQSAAEGERLRREFEREALTWCHLWYHTDIIAASCLTRLPGWDNMPVLKLEFAPGGSLRHTLSEAHSSQTGHLPLRSALAWGQQIAAALAVIHQPDPDCERPEPLVHCDLKPENVLFDADGWALLTDLGLTRAYATTSMPTSFISSTSSTDHAVDAMRSEQLASEAHDTRDARVARMRAALQDAGLLPATPANTHTLADDRRLVTRSVRVPPLSAALVATVLAPSRAISSDPFAGAGLAHASDPAGAPAAGEPGIGSRGPVAGTPPYMPPEQWWGLDAVTPASDVYALGVLLFELFAGGRWSPQRQRWLAEDLGASGEQRAEECYTAFPHAPQFSAEARLYAETGIGGMAAQQAYFAAWYAAHRSGPRWRLADPAVGALTRGPLMEMIEARSRAEPHAEGVAQQAETALHALSDLIADCLNPDAAQRPTAETVRVRLGRIARLVNEEPLLIPEYPRTPERKADFLENLGITYANIGQYEERMRLQRRVLELDPDDPQRWMNLGNGFYHLERYEEALAAYAEADRRLTPAYQAREPQRAARLALSIANNQASASLVMGRYEEAVAAYNRVLMLRPDWADTRFNLALTFARWPQAPDASHEQRLERLQAALRELHQVLADAPNYEKARALLADVERALARLRGA